ncbi:MAG TPA: aldo/keto reductase [Steroidobacteraceae bacterium]|nr:aldo/keto reductase [Steroidobacteraceae bacterium]
MRRRPFGGTGLEVPVLGFGAMQVGDPSLAERDAARVLNAALDAGLTLIDTARSYGLAEERIGRHLAARRDEFLLSTKVGYGIDGVTDWSYDCVIAGVDAARERLRTDVIDIVHLHSCGVETLVDGGVTRALLRSAELGKLRVAAYSGDGQALRWAAESGSFRGLQASVNLCDQQGLELLEDARSRRIGTIAKRPLAGRPWATLAPPEDSVHREYWRRFDELSAVLDAGQADWDALALRFAAYAPGVDCCIVGGTDIRHIFQNVENAAAGPLAAPEFAALRDAFARVGSQWPGQV